MIIRTAVTDTPLQVFLRANEISPKTEFSIEGRPFYATRDGHCKAVREVFA